MYKDVFPAFNAGKTRALDWEFTFGIDPSTEIDLWVFCCWRFDSHIDDHFDLGVGYK